jgi:hypothetical protein
LSASCSSLSRYLLSQLFAVATVRLSMHSLGAFQTEPEYERSEFGESSCGSHLRHLGRVVGRQLTSN